MLPIVDQERRNVDWISGFGVVFHASSDRSLYAVLSISRRIDESKGECSQADIEWEFRLQKTVLSARHVVCSRQVKTMQIQGVFEPDNDLQRNNDVGRIQDLYLRRRGRKFGLSDYQIHRRGDLRKRRNAFRGDSFAC